MVIGNWFLSGNHNGDRLGPIGVWVKASRGLALSYSPGQWRQWRQWRKPIKQGHSCGGGSGGGSGGRVDQRTWVSSMRGDALCRVGRRPTSGSCLAVAATAGQEDAMALGGARVRRRGHKCAT